MVTDPQLATHGGPRHRGHSLPVPLLLHDHRLASAKARHLDRRGHPRPWCDPAQLRTGQREPGPGAFADQLRHLHRGGHLGYRRLRVLAGYALARLHFRGRGALFALMLLVLVVPFQLLIIPLYVMIVRNYGLGDSYMGMILPFAINSTAVFIFRQFFLALPEDLFAAARIDGASELRILWSIALPLVRPALLTATLITFIGPWERVPLAVPGHQGRQPAATGGVTGELHGQRRSACHQPLWRDPSRRRPSSLLPRWHCSSRSRSTSPRPSSAPA